MSELAPPSIPAPEKTLNLEPSFFGALHGIWLFTWKSQLAWRRVPPMLLTLLILPGLIYLTTLSPATWNKLFPWLGRPPAMFGDLFSTLKRAGFPLESSQNSKLIQIYAEEYERGEKRRDDSLPVDERATKRIEEIRATHARIIERVRTVLNEDQFPYFKTYEERKLANRLSPPHEPPWGRTGPFYLWLVDFYFFAILPMACVWRCGALIRDELQADTLSFLTTRPLSRARLLILKYLAQTAWLQIMMVIQVLLLFFAGWLKAVPDLGSLLPLFLGSAVLAVFAWSALGVFLGQVTQRYMAVGLVYGLIVELGIGKIPTNINTLSLMRHLKSLLSRNDALQNVFDWTARGVPFSIAALIVAAVLFVTFAALMFTHREYHHTTEMQK